MTGIDDYIGNKSPSEAASSPNKNYTNLESSDSNDSFSKYGFSTNIEQIFNNNPEPLLQTPPYRPEYIDPITDQVGSSVQGLLAVGQFAVKKNVSFG